MAAFAVWIPQPTAFAQQSSHYWAEVGRSHDSGHYPRQQFCNDHRPLHTIADGAENRRAGVGSQRDSETPLAEERELEWCDEVHGMAKSTYSLS